jgi:hypothetical protein
MRAVTVHVSDPWELAGSEGLRASVLEERDGTLLLELDAALEHSGISYRRFVATRRGPGGESNLHGIANGTDPPDPLGLEWWRGGLGMIARVTPA